MPPVSYAVNLTQLSGVPLVQSDSGNRVTESAWETLASRLTSEPALISATASALQERWNERCAVIALINEEIVGYSSVIPVYTPDMRATVSLQHPEASAIKVDVFEFSTGWTAPAWRRFGISTYLHERTIELIESPKALIVGVCQGLGSSRILAKLGFQITDWMSIPFTSAISGWYESGCWYRRKGGWRPEILLPPCAGIDSGNLKGHRWSECVHYWVSDSSMADSFNSELCTMMGGSVSTWRQMITALGVAK